MTSISNDAGHTDSEQGPPRSSPQDAAAIPKGRRHNAQWWVVIAGLCAGLASFGLGEAVYELLRPEAFRFNTMGTFVTGPNQQSITIAEARNGALAFGILGACLGAFLGVAGGLTSRSASKTLAAAVLGVVLGAGAG